MIKISRFAAAAALLLSTTAQANLVSAPSASFSNPNFQFVNLLDAGYDTVEAGRVDADNTLFWFEEQAGSYYLLFDPLHGSGVRATLSFDAPIVAVYYTHDDLVASHAEYGIDTVAYAGKRYDGLEFPEDYISWSGNTLNLGLIALDPGDHLRVVIADAPLSPVPEPKGYAMLFVGLGIAGLMANRRLR